MPQIFGSKSRAAAQKMQSLNAQVLGNALWGMATAFCDDNWSQASPVTGDGDKGYPGAGIMIKLPGSYTPYALRRSGATALFQYTGSYAMVAERGRQGRERAMRGYINKALLDIATDSAMISPQEHRTLSAPLHRFATKGGY